MARLNVAVVGTGAVGEAMLAVLAERHFPVAEIKVLATSRSAGKKVFFAGQEVTVQETTPASFAGVHLALFAGGDASKEFAGEAVRHGAVVIDNSSTFRLDPDVPLVVPEVNPEAVRGHHGIIANPNCSTIQMVVALKPLYDAAGLRRVVVSTYQAISGAGSDAIAELLEQIRAALEGREAQPAVLPQRIAFNLFPHIDVFLPDGSTKEEMKMVNETHKIMGADIPVTATCVRVPVVNGHAEAVNVETEKKLAAAEAREILRRAPGIVIQDDPAAGLYPMPFTASGRDEVFVGRIREDNTVANGLNLWVVADNLRKGAATNAVQIAEVLREYGML
ncbi:MAG: aspartate-semialdehyde dehydrogenase [Clostridia bacterium]|nr:MAG: aspartate-semialdehyde dehydrogenase [Clostridia bacterium]